MQRTPGWQEYGEAIVARYDKTLWWLDIAQGVEDAKREAAKSADRVRVQRARPSGVP